MVKKGATFIAGAKQGAWVAYAQMTRTCLSYVNAALLFTWPVSVGGFTVRGGPKFCSVTDFGTQMQWKSHLGLKV